MLCKKSNFRKLSFILTIIITVLSLQNTINVKAMTHETLSVSEDSTIPLYNDTNEIVAFYFSLNNGGYVIVNSDGSDFIEYSLEPTNTQLDNQKKYYYSSPCSLYEKVDDSVIRNSASNDEVALDEVMFEIEPEDTYNKEAAKALSTTLVSTNSSTVTEENSISNTTKKYDYNPDGRCGSVAGAIVLRYYNDYVDTKYVASSYETSNGRKLINLLTNNYLGTGTNYTSLKKGLNEYLSDSGISSRFNSLTGINSNGVFSKIKTLIKSNMPLIVGLTQHPTYGEHWVVGTGYSIVDISYSGNQYVVIVNDGWGNTSVRINFSYVDGCLYIK